MRIKVCGLTREEDVRLACRLGAWAVGFVFAPLSPRRVDLKQAARLRAAVAPGVLSVGVFEDGLTPEIEAAVAACRLDAVQLHGVWPLSFELCTVTVFRALGLSRGRLAPVLSQRVSGVLVEPSRTAADRSAGRRLPLDDQRWAWSQALELKRGGLITIVAGGLNVENVGDAVAASRPDAVDVSSGVESALGVKDEGKLKAFFKAAAQGVV